MDDDFNFAEKFASLTAELKLQMDEEAVLNKKILENLTRIKI